MKTTSYLIDPVRQIWCFPDFRRLPDSFVEADITYGFDGDHETLIENI